MMHAKFTCLTFYNFLTKNLNGATIHNISMCIAFIFNFEVVGLEFKNSYYLLFGIEKVVLAIANLVGANTVVHLGVLQHFWYVLSVNFLFLLMLPITAK